MPQVKPDIETFAKIKVVGIGGSGNSAIQRMIEGKIRGVDFLALNTDVQALHHNSAQKKLHIGKTITRGLGAGMNPELGKRSAEESQNEIREALKDTDMIFITCGLGGGTGSGAGPVVAEIARDMGILTVAVVTKPFTFEGPQRKQIAESAYEELSRYVDTVITIPNDRILQIIDKKTSLLEAFKIVDDVLRQGVQGISELITVPGLINVDFADVKTIMSDTGSALMGIGIGTGENRATDAAKAAISSPLLEVSIDGAKGILFSITGGTNLGMQEVAEAAKIITSSADDNVKVIFGAVIDETMGEDVRVTVVATGFDDRSTNIKTVKADSPNPGMEVFTTKRPMFKSSIFNKKVETRSITPRGNNDEDFLEEESVEEEKEYANPSSFSRRNVGSSVDMNTQTTQPRPQSTSNVINQNSTKPKSNEEDLEIPAFIRKKMGM
ncbi:MAG: cell division protein FtsZ [Candidatus Magasanikbacteria bacterium CG10_big_fil_rev_8_21_14_0_10_36_16]|uniref:Cell division protein FtsZ n=1 Tax=Candidatus Magasanikbacteria bacterium CG10_big_fil_rev_8_21_14_0_10_36_16 TaxID=1974645 RepID=A0A2H0TY22_9BACT|nr:MAG: cell division protein FtsZ [Candidatus Magasanikbacteria bacterium CG10_big_fil_rev_8_21_14_0_10_36_16]